MQHKIILNEDDIKKILAENFGVNKELVLLKTYQGWVGYGPGEHKETFIEASITTKEE